MRKITMIMVILCVAAIGFAQHDTIVFPKLVKNKLKCPVLTKELYKLPLVFRFDASYTDKTISFYRDKGLKKIIVPKGTFGNQIGKDVKGNFFVSIDSNRLVSYTEESFLPAGTDSFFIKIIDIGACGPFIISGQTDSSNNRSVNQSPDDSYVPGYSFYDAVALSQLKDSPNVAANRKVVLAVLNYYHLDSLALAGNPFLKDYFNKFLEGRVQAGFDFSSVKSIGASISNLPVTNIADGIAQFLIKRGKEELDAAFFNQMKKYLDKHEECGILFPATVSFLENIDPYKYSEFLQSLREAFYKDLSNLIIHLNQVADLPKYDSLFIKHPEIKLVLRTANIVSELTQSGSRISPDSVISQFAALPWNGVSDNLGNSFKLLNIISHSLRDKEKEGGWVQLSDLNQNLFANDAVLHIYFGLLYQQAKNESISFHGKENKDIMQFTDFLEKNINRLYAVTGIIENFSLLADDVDKAIEDLEAKTTGGQPLTNDDYYTYINKAINIIDYGFKIANSVKPGLTADKYVSIARSANDLYKNVYTKNYNNAIMNASNILDSLLPADSVRKLVPGILKYGNFMASVVKSASGADVEQAIESAALPAGSYSIKQRSAWNLSLNGYIGYAWDYGKIFSDRYANGIYAPVGIAFSRGSRNNSFAVSLFASVIDVGALATYRLNNGIDDSLKQEITLGSILSPSAQLMIEKVKLPFALCLGWRLSPKLTYKKGDDFTTISARNVFNAGILIDIPFFTLWNKPFLRK